MLSALFTEARRRDFLATSGVVCSQKFVTNYLMLSPSLSDRPLC